MKRIFFCLAAVPLLFSCGRSNENNAKNTTNLFSADEDTLLFAAPPPADSLLAPDSAFERSAVVVAGRPLSADSTTHGGKAGFYLICAAVDTVLKGHMPLHERFYFAASKLPPFAFGGRQQYTLYLSAVNKNARLIAYHLSWQWTQDAPTNTYSAPEKDTTHRLHPAAHRRRLRHGKHKIY